MNSRVCLRLNSERKKKKNTMTDVKIISDDTHQSFDSTHAREYNVHV